MRLPLAAALLAVLTTISAMATRAAGSDEAAILSVVLQYTRSVNAADRQQAVALCAPEASIIDDFPPHSWIGTTACSDWWTDLETFEKANAITGDHVDLGRPRHIAITGDHAYVVLPVTYKYRIKGKPTTESGSIWTFTLQKLAPGWRITGSAWAQH